MANGIIILPISDEPDARPMTAAERAEAVRRLCAQVQQTGDQISAAALQQVRQTAPQQLAALSDQLDQLAQRAAELAAAHDEPARTELDSIAAEYEALRQLIEAEQLDRLPKLDNLPEMRQGLPMPLDRVTRQIFERGAGRWKVTQSAAQSAIIALLEIGATADTVQRLEKLTAYDKRLLLAVGGLCENDRLQFTFAQLWAAMGGGSRLNARQREQMRRSLWKLSGTRIKTTLTAGADSIKLDFALLEYAAIEATYKGQKVDAIEISAKPKWLKIAEARRQITALPFAVFADGLSLTEQSIALSDYLLTQIAHMKRQKDFSRQMRLDSIATAAGANIADWTAQKAFCAKIEKKLAHYAATGFIAGFTRYAHGYKIEP